MAAVSDRFSRAVPFYPLKPFDSHGFADRVMTRRRPATYPPVLTASITRLRKSCE